MRCHPARWLWGLIPIAMLSWIAVHVEADRVEHDLEQRARSALLAAGHDWASIVFSGRDGVLVGTARQPRDPVEALALVRSVWGVRSVEGRTRLADEAAPAPSRNARAPRSTRRRNTAALPPVATPITALEVTQAVLPDLRPIVLGSAGPRRDVVAAREQETMKDAQGASDAQKTQSGPHGAALETAAIAADGTGSAEECRTVVRALAAAAPVRFARGQSDLDGHSRAALDRFVAQARGCPHLGLKVSGHTDARGKARRNLSRSRRRAHAVVTYLIDKGIDAGRLEAVGYGEVRPVAPNDTAQNRAKNRRIEVEITEPSPIPQISSPSTRHGAGNGLPDR